MRYKLLKDLPGCKAGVVSEVNESNFAAFGEYWYELKYIQKHTEFFEEVKEKWYITMDWRIVKHPTPSFQLQSIDFDSKEEAKKYKRWNEPRFSLQDVEDAVLKNSANVTDEIEKL